MDEMRSWGDDEGSNLMIVVDCNLLAQVFSSFCSKIFYSKDVFQFN